MALRRCYGCMNMIEEAVCPHCGYSASQTNDPNHLPAGTVLRGQYLVGKVLGHGGFGITYIGCDLYLDMVVAIKEFFPASDVNRDCAQSNSVRVNTADALAHYEQSRERFLREAKTLARLQNVPEIVGVKGFFTENNTAYIIMEYVSGVDLCNYVRQRGGRVPAAELLELMEPVLRALDTVHREGIVHRDISPDNIMMQYRGGVKLLDFGAVHAVDNLDADIDLSHSTEAILKHGFAPMEQYRSRGNLGPWTDEYGICASIYYCLTGRLPPDAPSRAMGEEDVNWQEVPGLTDGQRAALEKGMSMRAKDRFGDLEALRSALYDGTYVPEPEPAPVPVPAARKKKGKKGWIAAVLVIAALGAGALWFLRDYLPDISLQQLFDENGPVQTLPPARKEDPAVTLPPETEPELTEPEITESETTQPLPEETVPEAHVTVAEAWEKNLVRQNPLDYVGLERFQIYGVTFLDSTEEAPKEAVDISYNGDGSVLAWKEWDVRASVRVAQVFLAADGGMNGRYCCEGLFRNCINLESIDFGRNFHTDQAESMAYMYYDCYSLSEYGAEYLNTSSVRDMQYMFALSSRPGNGTPDVSLFDTSNVENMSHMFADRTNTYYLSVSNWDMHNVKDISAMFKNCKNISSLTTGEWDLSSVENMSELFSGCQSLTYVNVGSWDLSNVRDMSKTFFYCIFLENLDVKHWDVSSAENMSNLFFSCIRLKELEVEGWDVSNVTDMTALFGKCSALKQPDVTQWEVSNVIAYEGFFDGNALINGNYWKFFFSS